MSSKQLTQLVGIYLEPKEYSNDELEVKFGTKGRQTLTRMDFDNVIQTLKSRGFEAEQSTGYYRLTIQNEFIDKKSGDVKLSNIRTEIPSLSNIKNYCKKNNFPTAPLPPYLNFVQKRYKFKDSKRVMPVEYNDFNFRIALKEENTLESKDLRIRSTLHNWDSTKKNFRFIKRFTFIHKDYPLQVDCSIVKSSNNIRGRPINAYTIQDSNVFNNKEQFEIEIEIAPLAIIKEKKLNAKDIIKKMKKVIRFILGGLQETNFPIGISEQRESIKEYMKLFLETPPEYPTPKNFIGPSSISLEMANIIKLDTESSAPNIRHPYTLTDKADGLRKLLFIAKDGKIYLITTNMRIQFTGCRSENGSIYNSLIDGEHVLHNKMGKFINLFLMFDIYFKNTEDLRPLAFVSFSAKTHPPTRLEELASLYSELHLKSVTGKETPPLSVKLKTFYKSQGEGVFNNCKKLLESIQDGLFDYETDGLIFTPANKGVASNTLGKTPPARKITWIHSLKWKPKEFNTIDFLVTTKKNAAGQDIIGNIFEAGEDMSAVRQIPQYKTLILRVGYDERKHGYLNPCQDIIDENYPTRGHIDNSERYKPAPFYPTNPSDPNAAYCNVKVRLNLYGNKYMLTENGHETFEDNTIVEFRYDSTRETYWRWIPIRVRYDKTAEYRRGLKNFGNAFHVAESVWRSIHDPITAEMLKTGKNIPDEIADDDVYYKRAGATNTRALRDFHNLYAKRILIEGVADPGGTLIDLAVGKAGDLPKWIHARLSFVLGIDVSKDNIENRKDGACARYLNYKKRFRIMPAVLFIEGNSSLNVRNGNAAANQKGANILRAVFGEGPKDVGQLGAGVYKQYGKGKGGFDIVSCQFALHYFFQNQDTLQNLLRNVSENCAVNGYFIGCCYDGHTIFEALEGRKEDESIGAADDTKKVWEITKKYNSDTFEDNETSVGYAINVYQESINKVFKEYLVNFNYLSYLMNNYGFSIIAQEEAGNMGLPNGTGLFSDLFAYMSKKIAEKELRRADVGKAYQMTPKEKQVSFYNRYFVFKKNKHVEADKILRIMIDKSQTTESASPTPARPPRQAKKRRKKPKKMNKRINIESISST